MKRERNLKKQFKIIAIILFLSAMYSTLINGEFSILSMMNLISVVISCTYISSLIVLVQINENYVNNIYKYLAIGFASAGILSISYMFILNNNFRDIEVLMKITKIFYLTSFYEIIVLIFSFKHINVNMNIKKIIILSIIAIFLTTHLGVRSQFRFMKYLEIGYSPAKVIVEIIIIVLYIYVYFLLKDNRKKIDCKIFNSFKIYILLRIVTELFIISTLYIEGTLISIVIIYSLKLLANFFVLKIMVFEVIKSPHDLIYNSLVKKSRDLEDKILELERKNKEEEIKNHLLANISHEFKTPVNVIYSAIQMQEVNKESNDINKVLKFNDIIKQNCFRLIRLINNFIDSSKINEEDFKVDLKCINIVELVENTTMSILAFSEAAKIDVIFDTTDEEVFVLGDRDLLERVILNLLSNAIKYNKNYGKIYVNIKTENNIDEVIIEVEDTGIGIPIEKQKVIFNRFERVDKSLSRHKEGSGLGLNIVKDIINKLGGRISVFSEEGVKTKIRITLPKTRYNEDLIEEKTYNNELESGIKQKVELEMSDIYI